MGVYKTDSFCVTVPPEWKAFKVNDRVLQICKGGMLAGDILRLPYLQLNFSGDAYMLPPSKDGYYDIVEIEPHTLGRYTWQGFECESMGFRVAMLWTGEGKRQFQVSANLETPLGKISMSDKDVLEILASVSTYDDAQTGIIPPHISNDLSAAMVVTSETLTITPKAENGCKMCGAAFTDSNAKFCHNCGAVQEEP